MNDILQHYGVKGMRWGQRRRMKRNIKQQAKSDVTDFYQFTNKNKTGISNLDPKILAEGRQKIEMMTLKRMHMPGYEKAFRKSASKYNPETELRNKNRVKRALAVVGVVGIASAVAIGSSYAR